MGAAQVLPLNWRAMNVAENPAPNEESQTNATVGESFAREVAAEPDVETIEETLGYAPPPLGSHAGERTHQQVEAEAQSAEQSEEQQSRHQGDS